MAMISLQTARRIAIHKQKLCNPRPPATADGILEVLQAIRCLQIDPIRAVERTQYLVLLSRIGPYDPALLERVAYEDRKLFEFWAHAASYVLTEDYPIHSYTMRHKKESSGVWARRFREWREANQDFQTYILDTIREEGPKMTAELEDRSSQLWESGVWWSSRNTALMIQWLWDRGVITVSQRDGLKKYWDLIENVHPEFTDAPQLNGEEVTRAAAQLSLKALGIANARQIKNHFTRKRYPQLGKVLNMLESEGQIVRISIDSKALPSRPQDPWYVHADDLPLLDALEKQEASEWQPATVLLSPFDNLIADRDRTELLWDFFFRIEIYVPAKKREYGYYVMPILHHDRLIGRIDPRMDRKSGVLEIQNVYAEREAPTDRQSVRAIRGAIDELGTFLNANRIDFTGRIPDGWQALTHS